MNILGISGSASKNSSNFYLLKSIQKLIQDTHQMEVYEGLDEFQLFSPQVLESGIPENIQHFKQKLETADAVIISTPEYTHNIPAVLKNMIEWCTHSGEFSEKRVLPITFTPKEPRGEFAMQSLLQSLQSMQSKIVSQLPLYKTDVEVLHEKIVFDEETKEMIKTSVSLFG